MAAPRIAVHIDDRLLKRLDSLVKLGAFPNRSAAIQEVLKEKLARTDKTRLGRECAKLDPEYEQTLAEEVLAGTKGVT